MMKRIIEHVLSIVVVLAVLIFVISKFSSSALTRIVAVDPQIKEYAEQQFIDTGDPYSKALFGDMLNLYYPEDTDKNKETVSKLVDFRQKAIQEKFNDSSMRETLNSEKINYLLMLFLKFFSVYVIVMCVTYYGAQTIGVWRFIRYQQRKRANSYAKSFLKIIAGMILFSPAYVISYALKTELNTDTIIFMVILAVFSNGLLITYSNRFFTLLVAESRKGYVDTAIVKNLSDAYNFHLSQILKPVKHFEGHVLSHIFNNARSQYLQTLKEQASFVITGLVIIEMALNIHGYLNYEMMRHILYGNYDIVLTIMAGIFIIVKLTEISADVLAGKDAAKYENS
ncbi:MAG: hypothetical protein JNL74_22975 [Fibrobacteres bacterium]|nr:hypothetical protein [Fibrobacterota bacterium]